MELIGGKARVVARRRLETGGGGGIPREPFEQVRKAPPERVHVPGGEVHGNPGAITCSRREAQRERRMREPREARQARAAFAARVCPAGACGGNPRCRGPTATRPRRSRSTCWRRPPAPAPPASPPA